jgi:hypothetical protein
MGYRTLVVLYNDQASEWEKDPALGAKIAHGMNHAMGPSPKSWNTPANLNYGMVVQCAHADEQTLAVLDGYSFTAIGNGFWRQGEDAQVRDLRLLKEAADRLGYSLRKNPAKKA